MRTFTLLFTLLPTLLCAQLTTPSIEVSGIATRSVAPNEVSINMELFVIQLNYSDAIEELDKQVNDLQKTLRKEKIDENSIRSSNYMIGKNTTWESGIQKDSGYFARQNLHVSFPFDQKRLGDVITATSENKSKPSISLSFGLDSTSSVNLRKDLMKSAVRDARSKASLIVSETSYEIMGIHEIKYVNTLTPANPMMTEVRVGYGTQPQDLNVTETVTVRYFLRPKE